MIPTLQNKLRYLSLSVILITSGCASYQENPSYVSPSLQPLSELTQVASSAASATRELARARNAVSNATMTHNQRVQQYYQDTYSSKALNQSMTFYKPTFMKASKILKQLFIAAGWTFTTSGEKPPVPIMVQVQGKNKPIMSYIHDIESQIGVSAKLYMYPSAKYANLKYAANNFKD